VGPSGPGQPPDRMELIERHALVEEVLGAWQEALGTERAPYRGHVYRVLNYARALIGSERHDDALAVGSAFHDLGIWSDRTFDYLPPSIQCGEAFRQARMPSLSAELLARMIGQHHRLRRIVDGPEPEVVEAFRRADLVDLSRGVLRGRLPRERVRELTARFPYAGFHGFLARTGLGWAVRHPFRPLPMVRLR